MSQHFEIAIIGAGPAGISAAANAAHNKLSHVLIEKSQIANTIYDYQLRKHVMAEPGRLPLRAKCRFSEGSREKILREFEEDIQKLAVNLVRAEVSKIEKKGDLFEVRHTGGLCTAKNVILSIGVQGTPRKLGVPGEELAHVAYTLSDPDAFVGRSIIVVGAGDAAIENALALSQKNNVYLVNRGDEFARAKDANAKLIAAAIAANRIRCFYNATIARIESGTTFINTPQGEVAVACDHLIARLGGILPRKFLESVGVQFPNSDPGSVPAVNARYESNVPGLYILGALIGYPLIKQAMNQGFEVIEHIRGVPCEPADQPLLEEKFKYLPGGFSAHYPSLRPSLPLFTDISEPQLREMLLDSEISSHRAGEVVFARNDYTDTFWSIISGSVEIEIDQQRKIRLGKGNFFGEMGLISGRRRVATVKVAEANTLLVETPRKQILKLMASVDSVRRALDEVFMKRALQLSIFSTASVEFLDQLVKKAKMKSFKKGEVLFREGDIGDNLFVIRKGSVKISRRNRDGKDVTQTYIAAGGYVGEMALLSEAEAPRSATVTAAVACETIVIEKCDFLQLLEVYPTVRETITRVAEERRIQNIVADSSESTGSLLEFMSAEGLTDAESVLLIDSDLCVGCDNCEAACAATHRGYSRLDRKAGKSLASIQIPISCRHCENPLCMTDCPPNALTRLSSGEVVIRDSCIGCGNCVSNCPYGVIQLVYDKTDTGFSLLSLLGFGKREKEKGPAKAAKCDQCHDLAGGPACVRACPTGAAMRVSAAQLVQIANSKRI
jgi:CRP-like cAMP-binding protein/thioredoxin reductase/Fe-S-cluster-containing hydrogenase component 2